ncbi:MAG TPA: LytTR family DNA-binding domain-containing protein [Arenimonas sp.]|uniref:LytR/AlgR family response regulator transcription factor n=1 Tax=Arenimonas sp. TaxID=1872635 RepID=UPI002C057536|nr:LytTR family DNA-binding domain-containing protein [Arenimonas sp.]HMB57467.1 LytTR family DNA-binding domain-containing protein [Arenimonas sp.]
MKTAIRALIADDEAPARRRLQQLLASETDIEVVGEASDGLETVNAIERLAPDLVFLDVQMPELDGFDVVATIGIARMPATIFVTAHDHYALAAFEANAMDYLLKPFDQERFLKSLRKARSWLRSEKALELQSQLRNVLNEFSREKKFPERMLVRAGDSHQLIRTADLQYVKAEGNYVRLHTIDGQSLQMRESLRGIEERLDPQKFRRIHRSHIVNLDQIKKLLPWFGGDCLVMMADGCRLTLSRSHRDALKEFM